MTQPSADDRCRVVVSVGTDHHRFDRLIDWIDRWTVQHPTVRVVVQRGTSRPPATASSVDLMAYDDLISLMAGADAVVVQGGPAGIVDARAQGRLPIVVPRRGDLGEHVDGHQVTFSRWMADRGLVRLAETEADLHGLLDAVLADPATGRTTDHHDGSNAVAAFGATVDPLFRPRRSAGRTRARRWRRLATRRRDVEQ